MDIDKPYSLAPKFIRLCPKEYHNLIAIHPVTSEIRGITAHKDDTKLDDFIFTHEGVYNLYYSVNEPYPDAPDKKLTKKHIKKIWSLFIDVDPDKTKDFNAERKRLLEFAKDLQSADNPPTYIIDSGGGIQAFWQLDEPVDTTNAEMFENLGRGLAKLYHADNVQNIDRIMRIPFTTNIPTKAKLDRPISTATVIHATKKLYTKNELLNICEPIEPTKSEQTSGDDEFDMSILNSVPDSIRSKWKKIKDSDPVIKGIFNSKLPTRSEYDMALISRLKDLGWSLQDSAYILYQFPLGKNKELTAREITRSFNRAASRIAILAVPNAESIMAQPNPLLTIKKNLKPKRRYKFAGEVSWQKTSTPIFKNFIDKQTLVALYGQSNVGKSFTAIDISAHLSAGLDWAGFKLKGGKQPVLYVAAEAGATIGKRIDAVKRRLNLKPTVSPVDFPFTIYDHHISLIELENGECNGVNELKAQCDFILEDTGTRPTMIVIDTLSAVFGGGNENSSEDMGILIDNLLKLSKLTACTIFIVHHSGKDQAAGLRGHTKLIGSVDTSLEVRSSIMNGHEKHTLVARKQRDNDKNVDIEFNLNVIELGKDEDGDPVTSCHILLESDSEFQSVMPHILEQLDHDSGNLLVSILVANKLANYDKTIQDNLNNYSIGFYNQLSNHDKTPQQLKDIYDYLTHEDGKVDLDFLKNEGLNPVFFRMKTDETLYKRFIRGGDKLGTNGLIDKNDRNQYVTRFGDKWGQEGDNALSLKV